ncbi:MAG: hypothetical protein KCHDKBKB_01477 [Elusimicrobia bacterium]|nr:hypothetical protein [Elusimicrobiota bacterium]
MRGARSMGLGNSGVGSQMGLDSALWNPAGVYAPSFQGISLSYGHPVVSDQDPEKHLGSFGLLESPSDRRWGWGLYGVHTSTEGFRSQREIGISFGRPLWETENGERLSVGASFGYVTDELTSGLQNQEKDGVTVGAGLQWILSSDFSMGFIGRDLNKPRVSADSPERRMATYGLGLNYQFVKQTRLSFDWINTESEERADVRGGLERSFWNQKAFIRVGSNRDAATGGLGLALGNLSLDYAYVYPYRKNQDDRIHTIGLAYRWVPPTLKSVEEDEGADVEVTDGTRRSVRPNRFLEHVEGLRRRSELSVGPLDVLQIRVKDHPELETNAEVDSWGFVQLPFIKDLKVDGLKTDQIEKRLTNIYQGFVLNPQVTVDISSHVSRAVYVFGEVHRPGKYPMGSNKVTVRDALVVAGLPTERAAHWRTFVIRQTNTGPIYYRVHAKKLLYRAKLDNNVILQSGDVVYVPMGILDRIVTFIGRLISPIFGSVDSVVTGGY